MSKSTLQIAWRNLWRNGRRTALALLAIAVGQWALLATRGLMRGYADNIQNAITGPMLGHLQVHHPHYRDERALELVVPQIDSRLTAIRALPEVADATPRIYAPVLCAPKQDAFIATVVGIDLAHESGAHGLLAGYSGTLKPHQVLIGYRLARTIKAAAGQEIAVVGQAVDGSMANDLYIVAGILEGPDDLVNQAGIVMQLSDAQELLAMQGSAHEIVIRARHMDDVVVLETKLRTLPPLQGLEVVEWRELMPEMVLIMDITSYSAYLVLALMLIAAVAGITNTVMMSTYERMHEFGMLLALGCSPGRIVRMILLEALFTGVLGVLLGTLMGWAFTAYFQTHGFDLAALGGTNVKDLAMGGLKLPLDIYPRLVAGDPLVGLIAVSGVSLLAAAGPALVAGRLDPMEAMRA